MALVVGQQAYLFVETTQRLFQLNWKTVLGVSAFSFPHGHLWLQSTHTLNSNKNTRNIQCFSSVQLTMLEHSKVILISTLHMMNLRNKGQSICTKSYNKSITSHGPIYHQCSAFQINHTGHVYMCALMDMYKLWSLLLQNLLLPGVHLHGSAAH